MLPGIDDRSFWTEILFEVIISIFVLVYGVFTFALLWTWRKPKILSGIVGWFGFLSSLVGVAGLILCGLYIALTIVLLPTRVIGNYELLMMAALTAIITGLILHSANTIGREGWTDVEWAFCEIHDHVRWPELSQLSLILLRLGVYGVIGWALWTSQVIETVMGQNLVELNPVSLKGFIGSVGLSIITLGIGQVLRFAGRDIYSSTIDNQRWLVIRFEFTEPPLKPSKKLVKLRKS